MIIYPSYKTRPW